MPFYEADNRQLKSQMVMEQQVGGEAGSVNSLLNDWKEDQFDIESLLAANNRQDVSVSQSGNYQPDHQVPTFNGSATRPNALDLTRAVKYEPGTCQQAKAGQTPISPHHSPYNGENVPPYVYGNSSPSTSNSRQTTPTSPYTRALHSPVSPHQVSPVSPHGHVIQPPLSPHQTCSRASSISPVPYQMAAVFGRYATDSPADSFSSYGRDFAFKRQHSPMDKNSEVYRAKRERNNIAVRRSREKKKQREVENEMRVQELVDENNKLQSKLDVVLKEMKLLKSLYKNIGISLPMEAQQKLEKELSRICS